MTAKHGYIWFKGSESAKTSIEVDGQIVTTVKKHSAKGQHGADKDGSAVVLEISVDCTNVESDELVKGYVEWWIINRFRRHSGILEMKAEDVIEKFDGRTFDPTVECLPPEGRKAADPTKTILRKVERGDMTKDEVAALIAQLQATITEDEEDEE